MENNSPDSAFAHTSPEPQNAGAIPAAPPYSGDALHWLKTLPNSLDRADLFALDADDFAIRCVRELVDNRCFELSAEAGHPASIWFHHFYFESKNREKVFGTRNLGIGYPLLVAKVGGYDLSAPLFVWQFQLEPHPQHADKWTVQRTEDHKTVPNYPLLHLLDALHGTNYSARARQIAESNTLDVRTLTELADGIRLSVRVGEEGLALSVQPCPAANNLEPLQSEGQLRWSAVAGIFPTLPRTMSTQAPVVAPNLPAGHDWRHSLTLLPLDPSQRAVLHAAQTNALTVVEGASGTGKTYLISAIVINALSNGKKCLVVSKSLNALRRAQKFLLEKGFGDVSFILRDIESDQLMLADMLRMAADNKNKASNDEELFKTTLHKTLREQNKLDGAWHALHQPVFGQLNFTETVGRFLRANRTEGKDLLLSQLNPADFLFNKGEYDGIEAAIYDSEPLFRRFPTLQHPLGRLNKTVFLDHSSADGLAWTEAQVKSLLDKATALHHRYIAKTNDYAEALLDHYEQHYFEVAGLTKRIRDAIEDGVQHFGPDFEKPASASEKLYGVFSDRYKQISAAKQKLGEDYEALRHTYHLRKYFDFEFPLAFDVRNIKKIAELARDFEGALRTWRRRIPGIVREDVRRLHAKSIHSELDFREQIKELEYAMDVFLEEFNAAGLYEDSIKHEMLTIPKRQEFLEDVIARLEDTQFYLRDFQDFYIWQNHWLKLSAPEQKVVRALCKIKPRNWMSAFESWYLHHLLQNAYNPGLQWDEDTLQNYHDSMEELTRLMPFQISALWQDKKLKSLRALKSQNASAYKTWFGKNNRALSKDRKAEELFQQHIEALTETLPALLVTPPVALDVVQSSNMVYDLVLVDEAHNIPKQECYHLFDLAKNLVVFGDAQQDMTPSAEDDLLEYCKTLGSKTYTLEYQHQDSPEEWIRFNQIAFRTPFKRLPSGRSANDVTVVANVEGRYDETTGTNEAEARQIIDWLNLIEPTPAKTYPVVGIACSTVEQRDLIASQLLKIRQRKTAGHEKIQQLHLNGLGVYQFAELQGQHVDILLLSITHGLVDAHGTLTNHLHFWNTQLGFNQLHVVLTRATQKIYIAHSIPPGLHTVLASNKSFIGTCVLSHLVTFGEQIQQGDHAAAEEQIQHMKTLLEYPDTAYLSTGFMQEVEIALQPYFEPGQLRRNALVEGVAVPTVVHSGEHRSLLLYDGVLAQTEWPSYEWEAKLKRYFNRRRIDSVPTLSVQWWKSPRQEARKLAARLLRREEGQTAG
ncbi:MAG: PhoH family protein [Saprospirales bacterium]|nr:PhoH family protein [Saprospirales bacterium]